MVPLHVRVLACGEPGGLGAVERRGKRSLALFPNRFLLGRARSLRQPRQVALDACNTHHASLHDWQSSRHVPLFDDVMSLGVVRQRAGIDIWNRREVLLRDSLRG
jgi:hypothetical protein